MILHPAGRFSGLLSFPPIAPVVSVWLILNNPRWDQGRIVEWTMAGRQKTNLEEGRTEWKGLLGIYLSRKIGIKEKVRRIERDWDLRFSGEDEEEMAMFEGSGMDLWHEAEQSGIQKGREEEFLRSRRNFAKAILSLSKAQNLPYAQYLQILKVPASEREELLSLIKEMQGR